MSTATMYVLRYSLPEEGSSPCCYIAHHLVLVKDLEEKESREEEGSHKQPEVRPTRRSGGGGSVQ